jgi:hypothetical protein
LLNLVDQIQRRLVHNREAARKKVRPTVDI